MELCSHLLSEITINSNYDEELTAVSPQSPFLAPIDPPTEIVESMEGFRL
jgi:hypothetical protein